MPLEDEYGDIIRKARTGQGMTTSQLAEKSGLTVEQITKIENYEWVPEREQTEVLAAELGLNGYGLAVVGAGEYEPSGTGIEERDNIRVISSTYHDYLVNTYIIWDAETGSAALFDTGTDFAALKGIIEDNHLQLEALFITHTHGDHIEVIEDVVSTYKPAVYCSAKEPVKDAQTVAQDDVVEVGKLRVEVRETEGHSPGGLTFVVDGACESAQVAVVGDAIFAGSAGGASISYVTLHAKIREQIFTLPDDTILLPGHGPATTVALEKRNNPFSPFIQVTN